MNSPWSQEAFSLLRENEQGLSTVCDKCYEGNTQRAVIENTLVVGESHSEGGLFKDYLRDEKSAMRRAEGQAFQTEEVAHVEAIRRKDLEHILRAGWRPVELRRDRERGTRC